MGYRVPLVEMRVGIQGIVKEVEGGGRVRKRLQGLGVRPGVTVRKISGGFGRGPVVVEVGNAQTALGFGVSSKITVEVLG